MTGPRNIRVVSVSPVLPVLLDWADSDPETRMRSDVMAAFKAGYEARDDEVARLRVEIAELRGAQS